MKNTSIFVVEDHSLTNLGIRQFFSEKSNFNCCGFASERDEAIEKLAELAQTENLPNVLILDLNLPGIDGFDLCKRINNNERFGKPAVIVITALESENLEEKVSEMGVRCFMKKPLDLTRISEVVKNIIEK